MNFKYVMLATAIGSGFSYGLYKIIQATQNAYKTYTEQSAKKREALQKKKEALEAAYAHFEEDSSDDKIAECTLGNKNLEETDDRGYLYGKLEERRSQVDSAYESDDEHWFKQAYGEFYSLYNLARMLDKKGLLSLLSNFREKDKEDEAEQRTCRIREERIAKYEHDIAVMKLQHQHESEILDKKIDANKAKLNILATVSEINKNKGKKDE